MSYVFALNEQAACPFSVPSKYCSIIVFKNMTLFEICLFRSLMLLDYSSSKAKQM